MNIDFWVFCCLVVEVSDINMQLRFYLNDYWFNKDILLLYFIFYNLFTYNKKLVMISKRYKVCSFAIKCCFP